MFDNLLHKQFKLFSFSYIIYQRIASSRKKEEEGQASKQIIALFSLPAGKELQEGRRTQTRLPRDFRVTTDMCFETNCKVR
jgi:hypothetical protein